MTRRPFAVLAVTVFLSGCSASTSDTPAPSTVTGSSCEATPELVDAGVINIVGTGFPADVAVTVTVTREDGSQQSITEADVPQLRTDARGRFEWTNVRAERTEVGLNRFDVEAGECVAAFDQEVPADWFETDCPAPVAPGDSSNETPYAHAVLADAPFHYWRFEETGGTEVGDSADPVAAAYLGEPALGQPGAMDGSLALLLDGDDDWVDVADLTLASDFTIEAWVFLCEEVGNADAIVGQGGEGPDINFFAEYLRLWDGLGDPLIANEAMPGDRWVHVVMTREEGRLDAYLDGSPVGAGSHPEPFPIAALAWGNAGLLRGLLDEVAIYDHALSPERVAAHAAAGGQGG